MRRNIERYDVSAIAEVVEAEHLFFVPLGGLHFKKQGVFQKSVMRGKLCNTKAGKSIEKTGV